MRVLCRRVCTLSLYSRGRSPCCPLNPALVAWARLLWLLSVSMPAIESCADDPRGAVIFREQCADCHGARGEGVADSYAKPLTGDRSLAELTEVISKTMPEEEPEACAGEDAAAVAKYVYETFYSEIAQARNRPAKVEFSRLTVRQYEHAVADLFRSFRAWGAPKEERGLRAQYFNSRGFAGDKKVIDRTDGTVDFDFGEGSPEKGKIGKEQFAIKWEGSLLAPSTGVYEFVIRTDNGVRLWVNEERTPLIDAWVRSGDGAEHRAAVKLLGGRMYPLKLEFFKFKDPLASVRLNWKPPHQVEQVIPQRCLTPERSSSTFVVSTPFPPDDRSTGFIRGTSVSPEWHEATTYAAIEAAKYAVDWQRDLAGIKRDEKAIEPKLREFCVKFAERAFRRPLSEEDRRLYVDKQFESSPDTDTALKRVVLLVLKSPRFLFREAKQGAFDEYDAAAWLSFALWDSIPDNNLANAAVRGQLKTREQIRQQAERMLNDPRARQKVREFLHEWLQIDQVRDIAKDEDLYPDFSEQLLADSRASLDLFLDDVVWGDGSEFRRLLTADSVMMNERMAEFYDIDLPPQKNREFAPVLFEPKHRAGVLSHPYVLTSLAYDKASSPIHRGVWLSRNVLGRVLSPPPIAVAPTPPDLHVGLTTRERTELQTSEGMCARCHSMINPLGYPLEHFDAVGRFRETEQGKPVDAAGSYVTRDGKKVEFRGTRELAAFLAESPEVHRAFAERLFQNLTKQPIQAFGEQRREAIREQFESSGLNIRSLIVEIATASTLAMREMEGTAVAASN